MAQLAISQETRANAVVLWLDGCLSLEDVDSFDHTLEQARRTAGRRPIRCRAAFPARIRPVSHVTAPLNLLFGV